MKHHGKSECWASKSRALPPAILVRYAQMAVFCYAISISIATSAHSQTPKSAGRIDYADGRTLQFSDVYMQPENSRPSRRIAVRFENTNRFVLFSQIKQIDITQFSCTAGKEQGIGEVTTRTGLRAPINTNLLAFFLTIFDELTGELKEQSVEVFTCARRFDGPKLLVRRIVFDN